MQQKIFPWMETNSKSYAFPVAKNTKSQLHCNSAVIPDVSRQQEFGMRSLLSPSQVLITDRLSHFKPLLFSNRSQTDPNFYCGTIRSVFVIPVN